MKRSLEKNLENMSSDERKNATTQLRQIVQEIQKYASSYFWEPQPRAGMRRSSEFDHYVVVTLGSDQIEFTSSYRESCRNCYYSKTLLFNGNKTTRTLLNNIIAKLEALDANGQASPVA